MSPIARIALAITVVMLWSLTLCISFVLLLTK